MSADKYTPGPWLRDERTVYALETVRGHLGRMETRNRFSFNVQGPHVPAAELEAVAALAQAAPDLLDALDACLAYIPGSEVRNWPPGFDLKRTALAKARVAIRKARGEE